MYNDNIFVYSTQDDNPNDNVTVYIARENIGLVEEHKWAVVVYLKLVDHNLRNGDLQSKILTLYEDNATKFLEWYRYDY